MLVNNVVLSSTDISNNYLKIATAASIYALQTDLSTSYLKINDPSNNYLKITTAASTYQPISSMNSYPILTGSQTLTNKIITNCCSNTKFLTDNSIKLVSTVFVKGQNYLTSASLSGYLTISSSISNSQLAAYVCLLNGSQTFTNKILPIPSFNSGYNVLSGSAGTTNTNSTQIS
jgi:hypothetical protein